jgi:hypothetical protein
MEIEDAVESAKKMAVRLPGMALPPLKSKRVGAKLEITLPSGGHLTYGSASYACLLTLYALTSAKPPRRSAWERQVEDRARQDFGGSFEGWRVKPLEETGLVVRGRDLDQDAFAAQAALPKGKQPKQEVKSKGSIALTGAGLKDAWFLAANAAALEAAAAAAGTEASASKLKRMSYFVPHELVEEGDLSIFEEVVEVGSSEEEEEEGKGEEEEEEGGEGGGKGAPGGGGEAEGGGADAEEEAEAAEEEGGGGGGEV